MENSVIAIRSCVITTIVYALLVPIFFEMEMFLEKESTLTKKRLMDLALEEKLIQVGKNKKHKDTSAYMALDTHILGPLQKWNFVTIEKSGKRRIVSLSEDGKNALKFINS